MTKIATVWRMRGSGTIRGAVAGALCLVPALALAPAAGAASVEDILRDYKQNRSIDPCSYSPEDLARARGEIPPDVAQYAPGFGEQLGQSRRCGEGPVPSAPAVAGAAGVDEGAPGAGAPAGAVKVPRPPAPDAARTLTGVPAPSVAAAAARSGRNGSPPGWSLVALAALAVLGGAGALFLHTRAPGPHGPPQG